jgi:hypothetical protein
LFSAVGPVAPLHPTESRQEWRLPACPGISFKHMSHVTSLAAGSAVLLGNGTFGCVGACANGRFGAVSPGLRVSAQGGLPVTRCASSRSFLELGRSQSSDC